MNATMRIGRSLTTVLTTRDPALVLRQGVLMQYFQPTVLTVNVKMSAEHALAGYSLERGFLQS